MTKANKNLHLTAIKAAFPHTTPIMAGFLFLGMSYGVLMAMRGFSFVYPMITSIAVFAGSMEFALAGLLVGAFAPLECLLLTLMINARHIFYGISMLDKYRGLGKKKIYMIFTMCDETFSVNYALDAPEGVDKGWFMFYVSLLNQLYWVCGATLGGIFGSLISTDIKGVDFAMTAMFVVILLEQILKGVQNLPSVICGGAATVLMLLTLGPDAFLLPSMLLMLASLTLFRKPIDALYLKSEVTGL